jgi:glycosyltransferase involved in cell wall biosynthesis
MRLGVDASNIREGGGITHLKELLRVAEPEASGFTKVIIWSGKNTLDQLGNRSWLEKIHLPILDKNLLFRGFWQKFKLSKLVQMKGCDLLYIPGGSFAGSFKPVVSFSQNLLPFEWKELKRYGIAWMTLKLLLLRIVQSRTFQNSMGVVYLTRYSNLAVEKVIKRTPGTISIIAHGIDQRFDNKPRDQKDLNCFSMQKPYRITYVSVVDVYKHQWTVAEAIAKLRKEGLPVNLELIGPSRPKAMMKLQQVMSLEDPASEFIQYTGKISFDMLHQKYATSDLCIFASSCENMPNILLEAMASGLPIACSNRGPMPEILKDAGVYFDPEISQSIADAVRTLMVSAELRKKLSEKAYMLSHSFSWGKCAKETFDFLKKIAISYNSGKSNV